MKTATPKNIDEYIAGFPVEVQELLEEVRALVSKNAPGAQEAIKYAMPAFVQEGNLCYFAAHKNHLGFYPVPTDGTLREEMAPYKQGKGSIQFPYKQPLPVQLVAQLVKWNIERLRSS